MRKRDIVRGFAIASTLRVILVALGSVFLISVTLLFVPAIPLVAVALIVALIVVAARSEHGPPRGDAPPQRYPLPRAHLRVAWRRP